MDITEDHMLIIKMNMKWWILLHNRCSGDLVLCFRLQDIFSPILQETLAFWWTQWSGCLCVPFRHVNLSEEKTSFWKCGIAQENNNSNNNGKISSELWFKAMMDLGRVMCYRDRTQYGVQSVVERTLISPSVRARRNRKEGESDKRRESDRLRQDWGGERHAALGRSEARCRRGP